MCCAAARSVSPRERCASGVLNSGVLALSPSLERLDAAHRLLAHPSSASRLGGDEGAWETSDQRLWHALYPAAHELPFRYNANADANLTRAEWAKVHVLHDLVVQRRRGWARSGHATLVEELTRQARRALAGEELEGPESPGT